MFPAGTVFLADMQREAFYQSLGTRVAALRHERGLTQAELGSRAGVGGTYVARIESGTRKPTLDVLLALAEGLETTIGRLIGEPEPSPTSTTGPARRISSLVSVMDQEDVRLVARLVERLARRTGR